MRRCASPRNYSPQGTQRNTGNSTRKHRHKGPQWLLEAGQRFGVDVASADDGYVQLGVRELLGVKDESGGGDGAAGFGDCVGIGGEIFHGLADFVFGDGNDVVDEGADVLEVDGADALGAQAVGKGAGDLLGGELDDLALTQAGLGVGG